MGEGHEEWERWGSKKEKKGRGTEGERKGRDSTGQPSRGRLFNILHLHSPPPTLGRRNLSPRATRPRSRSPPLTSTLPLSRQGAARPCVVPADLGASKLRLKSPVASDTWSLCSSLPSLRGLRLWRRWGWGWGNSPHGRNFLAFMVLSSTPWDLEAGKCARGWISGVGAGQ